MEYVKLGNSDLRVSRICLGCMGFGDPTIGQHSWTIGEEPTREIIRLTADDNGNQEEPYAPHNLSGVMTVNKPIMDAEPVWVAAAKNK